MKVAVSGAFGFIGRHVVAELQQRSMTALLIARPGASRSSPMPGHEVVELDINDPPDNAFDILGKPDVLLHLAWGGLPNYSSLHHFERELPSQYRFLRALVDAGLPSLVVAGTCFEYGMQSGQLSEEIPARPDNAYGFAKDCLRSQLQYLQQQRPFHLTWGRLFYLYGEGQPASSLRSQLQAAVNNGAAAFNMSGGEQLRDYLPVEEVARSLVSLTITNRDNGVVNICSGEPISIRKLVEGWISENKWSIALNLGHYPYPKYEPLAFWGDRRKLGACIDPPKAQPR